MSRNRGRRADKPNEQPTIPEWLNAWLKASPRDPVEVAQRIQDWQDRQKLSVVTYFDEPGLAGAQWDKEFRNVWLEPAPDGSCGIILDPMLLVMCRSGRSVNCVMATTRRAFYYYDGRVVAAKPMCGRCWARHNKSEFKWQPASEEDSESRHNRAVHPPAIGRTTPGAQRAARWLETNTSDDIDSMNR